MELGFYNFSRRRGKSLRVGLEDKKLEQKSVGNHLDTC